MSSTPKQLGFRMPAEWETHSAVWLSWPYDETTFPNRVGMAEQRFCEMIKALEGSEKVQLLVLDDKTKDKLKKILPPEVNFHVTDYADVWTRDFGPMFLLDKNKSLAWVKAEYNGYGKAEDPYYGVLLKDNEVFKRIDPGGQRFDLNMVLEGGSIEVDGQGALITTEQCLLNPNRNPKILKEQIEQNLKDYLGIERIVWLKQGLTNDHTDGHVDDITRFVGAHKVLTCYEDDPQDKNFVILKNNFDVLSEHFEVIKLPTPHMKYEDGSKAPVSYANFYIANKVVIVPTYADPHDKEALAIIQSCFPDRKVAAIDCRDIIYGGGAIHCMTQQQPV